MKVIGLEEHYVTAEVVEAWANLDPRWQDPVVAGLAGLRQRLLEIGDQRLAAMDDAGIDVQVASLTSPDSGTSLRPSRGHCSLTATINWPTRCARIPIDCRASPP